jgi:hypothetical protein
MAKACEMFVLELTMRAYQSKTDAADAVLKVNMTKLMTSMIVANAACVIERGCSESFEDIRAA